MRIIVKIKKPKQTIEFSNYDNFNAWLLARENEELWVNVKFDFDVKYNVDYSKNSVISSDKTLIHS